MYKKICVSLIFFIEQHPDYYYLGTIPCLVTNRIKLLPTERKRSEHAYNYHLIHSLIFFAPSGSLAASEWQFTFAAMASDQSVHRRHKQHSITASWQKAMKEAVTSAHNGNKITFTDAAQTWLEQEHHSAVGPVILIQELHQQRLRLKDKQWQRLITAAGKQLLANALSADAYQEYRLTDDQLAQTLVEVIVGRQQLTQHQDLLLALNKQQRLRNGFDFWRKQKQQLDQVEQIAVVDSILQDTLLDSLAGNDDGLRSISTMIGKGEWQPSTIQHQQQALSALWQGIANRQTISDDLWRVCGRLLQQPWTAAACDKELRDQITTELDHLSDAFLPMALAILSCHEDVAAVRSSLLPHADRLWTSCLALGEPSDERIKGYQRSTNDQIVCLPLLVAWDLPLPQSWWQQADNWLRQPIARRDPVHHWRLAAICTAALKQGLLDLNTIVQWVDESQVMPFEIQWPLQYPSSHIGWMAHCRAQGIIPKQLKMMSQQGGYDIFTLWAWSMAPHDPELAPAYQQFFAHPKHLEEASTVLASTFFTTPSDQRGVFTAIADQIPLDLNDLKKKLNITKTMTLDEIPRDLSRVLPLMAYLGKKQFCQDLFAHIKPGTTLSWNGAVDAAIAINHRSWLKQLAQAWQASEDPAKEWYLWLLDLHNSRSNKPSAPPMHVAALLSGRRDRTALMRALAHAAPKLSQHQQLLHHPALLHGLLYGEPGIPSRIDNNDRKAMRHDSLIHLYLGLMSHLALAD